MMAAMDTNPRRPFGRANSRPRKSLSERCLIGRCSRALCAGAVIPQMSQSFGSVQSGFSIISRAARPTEKAAMSAARQASVVTM